MPKVLVIGLDGATFDVIHPLVEQGRLPNLSFLLREGAWGPLQSAVPPITPTAWTSVFTGKNPGKHGVFDFQELDTKSYVRRPVRIDRHQEKSVWQLLGEAGKRSIILDVPYTYPPRPLEGMMITGYGTPRTSEARFTYPADLTGLLPEELHSEIKVALPTHRFDRSQGLIDAWGQVMDGRRRLLRHLMKEQEWEFFFVVFNITDNMAHIFWTFVDPNHPNYHRPEGEHFREAFFSGYEGCDRLIGELMEWAGPETTTLIMSDHGFGSVYPRQYLFQRLVEGGYLRYQSPPHLAMAGDWLMKQAFRAYNGLPFIREWLKNLRPQNKKAISRTLNRSGLMPDTQAIAYERSRVLPTNFGLQMWVNSNDHFQHGLVSSEGKGALLDKLSQFLGSGLDPVTGESIISKIHWGHDLYHGPAAEAGPDLVIEYNNFHHPGEEATHLNPRLEGGHTGTGIFLAHGPAVKPGQIDIANLTDLAPTILHLFDQLIPPDMDGDVIRRMFTDAFLAQQPPRSGSDPARHADTTAVSDAGYTPEEESSIEDVLRQLGYIS